jgi:hypothetical protein
MNLCSLFLRSLAVIGVFVIGAGVAPAQDAKVSGNSSLFFPLAVGDRWRYFEFDGRWTYDTLEKAVTGDTLIHGISYSVMNGDLFRFDSLGNVIEGLPGSEIMWYRLGDLSRSPWPTLNNMVARFDSIVIDTVYGSARRILGIQYFVPSDTNFTQAAVHEWLCEGIGLERLVWFPIGYSVLTGARIDGITYGTLTDVPEASAGPPMPFSLAQNYPNPFNPSTVIQYTAGGAGGRGPGARDVSLIVYDLLGRQVAVLVHEKKQPGSYEVKFDGSNLPSGVYFYRLTAGDFVQAKKLVIVK